MIFNRVYIGFILTLIGIIPSIIQIIGIMRHQHYVDKEHLPALKEKMKDLKNMFLLSSIILIISSSFLINELSKNEKLIKKQQKELVNNQKQSKILERQKCEYENLINELNKRNADLLYSFTLTENDLRASVYEKGEISQEIQDRVYTCFNNISRLYHLTDTSLNVIKSNKKEFENDSLIFNRVQIEHYIKTMEILEINNANSQNILNYMAYNLSTIMNAARRLQIPHSEEIIFEMKKRHLLATPDFPVIKSSLSKY